MTMVRVGTRTMKLSDKLGDLSEYVTADEAAGIRNDLYRARDTLETLAMVCAIGFSVLDRVLPVLAAAAVAATLITGTAVYAADNSAAVPTTVTTKRETAACPAIGKLQTIATDLASGKLAGHIDLSFALLENDCGFIQAGMTGEVVNYSDDRFAACVRFNDHSWDQAYGCVWTVVSDLTTNDAESK
jgi:hypothetical protein